MDDLAAAIAAGVAAGLVIGLVPVAGFWLLSQVVNAIADFIDRRRGAK